MSACTSTVYTEPNEGELKVADYTAEIAAADSHEDKITLLAAKQAAVHAGRPPRPSPQRPKEAGLGEIQDIGLRRLFERSKAREERREARALAVPEIRQIDAFETVQADREPVKSTPSKAVKTGSYANGLALAATISSVSMRPDLTWRAKALALALASHYPTVQTHHRALEATDRHALGPNGDPRACRVAAGEVTPLDAWRLSPG